MKVIGLTGGIASGKSTASNILKQFGIPVIDADIIAREIVELGKPALNEIKNTFGKAVINEDGSLNRKYLGKIVFSDKKQLEKLNAIMHKRIMEEIINRIDMYRKNSTYPVIIVDAALLIEMNMYKLVDEVWLVVADEKIQLSRLMERDKICIEDAIDRVKAQMSTGQKKKYADVIINNNLDIAYLKNQIEKQLNRLDP
ncbi:dephospho-CoA kinase [Crassaminicella thermophila]|uniref:Dephospho-CoA kinase n=1 Tax=Crassaminicella thermophila TaxID=2599308 RepID=A0A5C0SF09_CRATE|nr:dephospho-CoA kinase [Crassaminicella thermophila]QEK12327.1 dephospho-CoA kinase [Crassaminicella thermophila]